MFTFRRYHFFSWEFHIRRIPFGLEFCLPGYYIRFGHCNPPCRECGERDNILSWPTENPGAAVCPSCCEHEYEYDRSERDYICTECGDFAPYDWIRDYHSD